MKGITLVDAKCQADRHELINYPRSGLFQHIIPKDTEVCILKKWRNCYGEYYSINYNNHKHDILISEVKIIEL